VQPAIQPGDPSAPVLLLLHGFPTSSFMFRELIPRLAYLYRSPQLFNTGRFVGKQAIPKQTRAEAFPPGPKHFGTNLTF